MRKIAGVALICSPYLVMLVAIAALRGWQVSAIILGVSVVIGGMMISGAYLLFKG